MSHAALEQFCTLVGGFAGADEKWRVTIPGTHLPAKASFRYQTPGYPVGDVSGISLPCDDLGRAPQAIIPYIWIF